VSSVGVFNVLGEVASKDVLFGRRELPFDGVLVEQFENDVPDLVEFRGFAVVLKLPVLVKHFGLFLIQVV